MPRKVRNATPPAPVLPRSHNDALKAGGFVVMSWLNRSIQVQADSGPRGEWLPRLAIAGAGREMRVVEYREADRPDNAYGKAGWFPFLEFDNGGFYDSPIGALAWFDWLANAKARAAA